MGSGPGEPSARDGSIGARSTGLPALIETPEATENYLMRVRGQDAAERPAQRCIAALRLSAEEGLQILQGGMAAELLLPFPQGVLQLLWPPGLGCRLVP